MSNRYGKYQHQLMQTGANLVAWLLVVDQGNDNHSDAAYLHNLNS